MLVQKKTGDKRLCVDYRELNRKTKKEHYPLPRIEDQLDQLAGNTVLTSLAVVASLNRFRIYLIGIPFKIVTDCNALRSTLIKRDLIPRIARWWIQLQEFDCTIEYRPGSRMSHVDALSRNPVGDGVMESPVCLDVLTIENTEQDWIVTVQSADDEVRRIKETLSD